ncbi:MAG: hypothetical protein ACW99G_04915 [Candidatus Thorarchaeota archaeon]
MRMIVDYQFYFTDDRFLMCKVGEIFSIVGDEGDRFLCKFEEPGGTQEFIVNKPSLTWLIKKSYVDRNCSEYTPPPVAWEV